MAAQAKMQQFQMENQAAVQLEKAKAEFSVQKMKGEASIKAELMQLEFNLQMKLKGVDLNMKKMEQDGLQKRESERENAKSARISQANTEQSKLIDHIKPGLCYIIIMLPHVEKRLVLHCPVNIYFVVKHGQLITFGRALCT